MTAKKHRYFLFYSTLLLLFWSIIESNRVVLAAKDALELCARSLIPSLCAPLVLSGLLSALSTSVHLPGERVFSRIFRLPPQGLSAFLLGALCGFPIGVKTAVELYEGDAYNKEECMRIAALSANTGPAFAVAGIGIGFFHSARVGWCLYLIQIVSAVILGIFDAKKHPFPIVSVKNASNTSHFSLSDVLYRSSLSLLTITGTVVFFGTLCALPSAFLSNGISAILAALLEVGNGAYRASALPLISAIPLAAFSLSFSGVSVLSQNAAYLLPKQIPLAPIVYRKLLQGILGMGLALLLLPLLK